MKRKFKQVCQFKITLKHTKPAIWRRIQVPETYTFWDLHVALQDAMGWTDTHLHMFRMSDPSSGRKAVIGMEDEELDSDMGSTTLLETKQKISKWFSERNDKADYIYDFGDDWEHTIKLEKILPREKDIDYPICIAGARACPPEDCGGTGGYAHFLEIIMDPHHEEYEEMLEWAGGDFDPERFNPDEVFFDDPDDRLDMMDFL
ncbi:MAG: plasmid pRiA4b ORF-3 family protein [Thermodesulfovibrionales bacterium]|nr:plasmid pRiA4b ORF-3 family protein [Thermodesulfovibrionales bacterium]